ncbi:phosphate ABC transporter permease PstA [Rhabdothermincola sp.]|uniref:phosphate ABC transporter permease PstA n=1 Tax=Rhabdothermincola sp. TaxID=2820405 RepID=UPI002FE293D4
MSVLTTPRTDPGQRPGSGPVRPGTVSAPSFHRRRPRERTATDVVTLVGSLISAYCVNWLIFERILSGVDLFGFVVCTYLTFLVIFGVVTADRLGRLVATDRVVTLLVVTGALVVLVPLVVLIGYIVVEGLRALRPNFFVEDQQGITPLMPATAGGGSHAIVGTVEQVGLALLWSLPLGIAAAVFLNESRSRWRRPVRVFVDAMSGLPSIVAGLFIFAVLILPYAQSNNPLFGYNGFMASLALAITMLPTITRTVEVVLRLVPDGLREASLALGASRARTVWSVVFPTARTGMTTAVVLGIARAVGETAPLLFTAFGYDLMNSNPFRGPQESLPLFVYRNIRKPDEAAIARGFAGALVLMTIVLGLFAIARFVGRDRSRRQARAASMPRSTASSSARSSTP